MLVVVVGIPAYFMGAGGSRKRQSLHEELERFPQLWYYFIGVAVLALIYYLVNKVTSNYKVLGHLYLEEDKIKVEKMDEVVDYLFTDIKQLKISRGSLFHQKDDLLEKPYPGGNYMDIQLKNGDELHYEFLIQSEEHNKTFEETIALLLNRYPRQLKYISI